MTPAEELTQAADNLDALATRATDGPWGVYGNGDGLTAIIGGQDREYGVIEDQDVAADDAHYIAAMNPLVGKALAVALRAEAEMADVLERSGDITAQWVNGNLHAIARLINGSAK